MPFATHAAIFLNSQVIPVDCRTAPVSENSLTRAGNWLLSPIPYLFNGREVTVAYEVRGDEPRLEYRIVKSVTSKPLFEQKPLWKTALAGLYVATVVFWALGLILKALDYRFSQNARDLHQAAVRHITPRGAIFIKNGDQPCMTEGDLGHKVHLDNVYDPHNAPISAVVFETDGGARYGDASVAISDGGCLKNPAIQRIILVGATVRATKRTGEEPAFFSFLQREGYLGTTPAVIQVDSNECRPYAVGDHYVIAPCRCNTIEEALAVPLRKDANGNPEKMLISVPAPQPAVQGPLPRS